MDDSSLFYYNEYISLSTVTINILDFVSIFSLSLEDKKRDSSNVGYCLVVYTNVNFYKVPEKHSMFNWSPCIPLYISYKLQL